MLELAKWILLGIIPPRDIEDKDAMWKWMKAMAAAVGVWSLVVAVVTVLSFGFAAPYFSGFALASELAAYAKTADVQVISAAVKTQKDSLDTIIVNQKRSRIRDLDAQILNVRTRQCQEDTGNKRANAYAWDKIRELESEYEDLNGGKEYLLPSCDQL